MLLLAGAAVLTLFAAEALLAFVGFPAQLHEQVANPPHVEFFADNFEYQYLWKTNSRGLRYREVPLRKPANTERVFVVGDSVTDGAGVKVADRFTNLLESSLSGERGTAQFINAGLGGQGPLQYARVFHWLGTRYEPDGLLIAVNVNDLNDVRPSHSIHDIYNIARNPSTRWGKLCHALWPRIWGRLRLALDSFSPQDQSLDVEEFDLEGAIRHARLQGVPEVRIDLWKNKLPREWIDLATQGKIEPYLLYWPLYYPNFYRTALDIEGVSAEASWRAMAAILTETVRDARERGIEVAALFLPDLYQYDPSLYAPDSTDTFVYLGGTARREWVEEETEIQRRLKAWAAGLDVPLLDLTDEFRAACAAGEQLHFPIDGHWNESGHRLAAERIGRWVAEEEVFSFLP